HKGQVVHTVAEEVHHPERTDERYGHCDARDDGGAHAAEKGKDHQDDEQDREPQGKLHVVHRGPDSLSAIKGNRQDNGRRELGVQLRQDGGYTVDRVDDIGAWLAPDDEQDSRFAIDQPIVAQVFNGVRDGGDVREPYSRALPIGDNDRLVVTGLEQLVARVERPVPDVVREVSL